MSKTDWKPEDFEGSGQYLVRSSKENIEDTAFLSTIMVKVSYQITPHRLYGLTSMSDGWSRYCSIEGDEVKPLSTLQDLCDDLNEKKESQQFRPATQEEVVRVVLYQNKRCFVN